MCSSDLYKPSGDQPQAIIKLVNGIFNKTKDQVLLGATGTGKTFTIANVINEINKPTLVLAHNKTLAGQLYSELKELFPNNHVEYFVSYYDYYQPEAYVAKTDTFIEKDSSINEEIDELRHSATSSLLRYKDVIVVSSVSCIYGIGDKEEYENKMLILNIGMNIERDKVIEKLIEMLYERNNYDFKRGTFRVKGDVLEIIPVNQHGKGIRIEFFGDEIERITEFDSLTGVIINMAATSLMGCQIKEELGSVTIRINGGGPLGSIIAVSDNMGNVRGYLQDGSVDLPLNHLGKLDVKGGVGTDGLLTVIKDNGVDMPFSGKTELVSGEIAEDIAAYYVQSEQVPTVCALGVLVDTDQSVLAAGGFLIQLLPFAPDSCIDELEERIGKMKALTTELLEKGSIENVINDLLDGLDFEILETNEVKYECKCSQTRVEAALLSMGREELKSLWDDDKPISITCNFCDVVYSFTKEKSKNLLEKI